MKATDLRKAILQAAVQGKLVPQDKNDEPVSELLKRIQTEKATLVRNGKLKKEKPLPPITENEIPYDLPGGWVWCRFGEVSTISSNLVSPESYQDFLHLAPDNIVKGTGRLLKCCTVREDHVRSNNHRFRKGQIIYSKIRPALKKAVIAPFDGLCSADMYPLSVYICTDYFLFFLLSDFFTEQVTRKETRVKMPKTNQDELVKVVVPVPPIDGQRRIASKVKQLMILCDELEAAEKELDTLEGHFFDYLPKSILQAAVQGKLVPQDKNDEPASELLKRIQAEKAVLVKEGKLKKGKLLPLVSEDEIPYDLPNGWVWSRVGDIFAINPRNSLKDELKVSFLPMSLISQEYFGGHQQETKFWKEVKSGFTHFAEGDVLLAKITPCFQNGKSCIAHNLISGYGAGTTELHVLRCILVDSRYLLLFLKSPVFITAAAKNMTGTAGQQRVSANYLELFLFPIPPLAEQRRIIAKVDELMRLCDELKMSYNISIDCTNIRKVIQFPKKVEDACELALVARGNAEGLSSEALEIVHEMFAEDDE